MSWIPGNQKIVRVRDFTEEIKKIEGEMDDTMAKVTLAKFFRQNLGFTLYYLSGVEILPLQEIIIKGVLLRDNSIIVAGRGASKSFIISILSILYPLFYFNSKMTLISANFRGSRRILEETEKIITSKKARLLKQCYEGTLNTRSIIQRAPDMYRINIPEPCNSSVFALPMTQGLRGTRSSYVVVDEGLMVTKEIQETIIRPFLTAKQNMQEENEIKAREDELIKEGILNENDRISFPRNKFSVFSSASYTFEYLYEMYKQTIENIMKPESKEESPPSYFAMRFSYEAIPENTFIDTTQIKAAAEMGSEHSDYFKREYKALFTDSSDGYFNAKKLHECTVPLGDFPTTQMYGEKGSEYIISIDPSYASNKNSDYFAMGVYLVNKDERKITLVHTYGRSGTDLKSHFEYFVYLLTHFNIVFICIDASGTEFFSGFNESEIAKDRNIKIEFLDVDFDTDDNIEYNKALKEAKKQYNITNRRIAYAQKFNSSNGSIRRMNEHLQNQIEAKKVWFASACGPNENASKKYLSFSLPFKFENNKDQVLSIADFIEDQDRWIVDTKGQVALITVKSTASGVLQYELPAELKNLKSVDRPRKDNYTTLLLATWISTVYFNMIFTEETKENLGFTPFFV